VVKGFHILAMMLAGLWLVTGCQELTGATMREKIDDETLTSHVKEKLAEDRFITLTHVDVKTINGAVYLIGEVETAEQKSRIESLASQIEGVKNVDSDLQVLPSRFRSKSPRWAVFCAPPEESEAVPSLSGTGAIKCFGLYQ
jgi:translation elongation factor EF-1beta